MDHDDRILIAVNTLPSMEFEASHSVQHADEIDKNPEFGLNYELTKNNHPLHSTNTIKTTASISTSSPDLLSRRVKNELGIDMLKK